MLSMLLDELKSVVSESHKIIPDEPDEYLSDAEMLQIAEKSTDQEELLRIANRGYQVPGIATALAKNPHTPQEMLATIARTHRAPNVRRLIGQNPNTPPNFLLDILRDFPKDVLENPAIPLISIEDPSFMGQVKSWGGQPLMAMLDNNPSLAKQFFGTPEEELTFGNLRRQMNYAKNPGSDARDASYIIAQWPSLIRAYPHDVYESQIPTHGRMSVKFDFYLSNLLQRMNMIVTRSAWFYQNDILEIVEWSDLQALAD